MREKPDAVEDFEAERQRSPKLGTMTVMGKVWQ